MADQLLLAPSEFAGEANTCVCGRVVVMRGPVTLTGHGNDQSQRPRRSSKSGCKGGTKQKPPPIKLEVHILGGDSAGEVLFLEAWGDAANQLKNRIKVSGIYSFSGVKIVHQLPRYSTSRLPYFIRAVAPIGLKTVVADCDEDPWTDLPLHHPFTQLVCLTKVSAALQVCLVAVLVHQPGLVDRDTQYGTHQVCNAVVRQSYIEIRCAFWRHHATALAAFEEGTPLAFMQVTVKSKDGSWELAANESTQVLECPADLRDKLCSETDLIRTTGSMSLSKVKIDYETAATVICSPSAMAAVIQSGCKRDLGGIYEMHAITVMGVSAAMSDDAWSMLCCKTCKKKVDEQSRSCAAHPEDDVEERLMLHFDLADDDGSCRAVVFHDVLSSLPFMREKCDDPKKKQKIVRTLRAQLWTLRCSYKQDSYMESNYIEVKFMTPTIDKDGVVATWRAGAVPSLGGCSGCPIAFCKEVAYDKDLGIATVRERTVHAVRLMVTLEAAGPDDETALPDTQSVGLRVVRRARCALCADDVAT